MQPIPPTLAPFFQEYDLRRLDPKRDSATIIERTLQFGNRVELRWLFAQYPRAQITDWVRRFGKDRLPNPHRAFWQIVLEINECNFVYLANDVRVGFYGYGYPLVASLVETANIRLASIEDIALMKLDALLSRAARKDFYDLYFICGKIPLWRLLDIAPQKYPSVRDFETQVVKRLVFFENAEQDIDPPLLLPATWQIVKEYFTGQAKEIGTSWLE